MHSSKSNGINAQTLLQYAGWCEERKLLLKKRFCKTAECFILILDYLPEAEFHVWQRNFSELLKTEAKKAYRDFLFLRNCSIACSFFSAVHVVTVLSLKNTQEILFESEKDEEYSSNVYFKCMLETCCYLLNTDHWKYIRMLTGKCNEEYLKAKQKLFVQFLKKCIKKQPVDSKENSAIFIYIHLLGNRNLERFYNRGFEQNNRFLPTRFSPSSCDVPATNVTTKDIETEAKVVEKICDPPGQKSVYIPPGDTFKEAYRLSTFLRFPEQSPVNPAELAYAGFFYTGYKDRVKCFVCAITVESWMINDDPKDPRWHKLDCDFINGKQCGNLQIGADCLFRRYDSINNFKQPNYSQPATLSKLPSKNFSNGQSSAYVGGYNGSNTSYKQLEPTHLATSSNVQSIYKPPVFATIVSAIHEQLLKSLDLRKEADRLKTFQNWPIMLNVVSSDVLACFGFFYLGNADRCQCFSCGGVLRNWNAGDDVANEHKNHFPDCRMALGNEVNNIPLPPQSKSVAQSKPQQNSLIPTKAEKALLHQSFPCSYAVNPHMRELSARVLTFDSRWPSPKVHATPIQIAMAGFYFLGERDRVKCWYCNGGLQNWEPTDEPWLEHAKWFPTCEYLLQQKGPDFVHRIVELFPGLRRPVLRNGFDVPPSARAANSSSPVSVIDPQAEMRRLNKKVEQELSSSIAKLAQEMGFSKKSIKKAIKKKVDEGEEMYQNLTEMVDVLVADSSSDSDEEMDQSLPAENHLTHVKETLTKPSPSSAGNCFSESPLSMQERVKQLEDERQCKICLNALAEVVFVPCGHLCSCTSCAQSLRKCPLCRVKIQKSIKTYLS